MPLRTISQFKTALGGGGVRPNLFEVRLDASNLTEFMGGVPAENLAFMCNAANLPAQNVASAKRSSSTGRKKTVRLTPSQVAIAKRLGVPLEEYAKQKQITEGV